MEPALAIAAEYCRKARRVRAAYRREPAKMYGLLRGLKYEVGGEQGFIRREGRSSGERAFAEVAARTIRESGSPVLCYAKRVDLIEQACRHGVDRFEANLMIAVAQHRMGVKSAANEQRGKFDWGLVVVVLIVETLIVLGAWRVLG